MTDETAAPAPKRPRKTSAPEAEIIDAEVVEETATTTETEPVVATLEPGTVTTDTPAAPAQQVIYVQAPVPPKKRGNRGLGSILAVASAVVYAAAFAIVQFIIGGITTGVGSFAFVGAAEFWVPVLFYVIGLVLLVLIVNRGGWAAYVLGSILVGVLVYFGTIGVLVLGQGIVLKTPDEAAAIFNAGLRNPLVIAAALVAREVSLWIGALISRRGRSLKARNSEAHEAWERELAEKKAEHERGTAAPAAAE